MKFDRQLRPATETSWVVSYGGKTIPRRRTAAILKIDISPYLSEKSSDFHTILYTAADFELDEGHVIKNDKVALDRLRVRQNVFLVHCESYNDIYHNLLVKREDVRPNGWHEMRSFRRDFLTVCTPHVSKCYPLLTVDQDSMSVRC